MGYIIVWLPCIINIIMIFVKKDPLLILLIPVSLFVGLILLFIYDSCKISSLKSSGRGNSQECKKLEQDRNIAVLGMIAGATQTYLSGKDAIKDVTDVDHWKTMK